MSTPSNDTEPPDAPPAPADVLLHVAEHREFYAAVDRRLRVTPGERLRTRGSRAVGLHDAVTGELFHIDVTARENETTVIRLCVKARDGQPYAVGWTCNTPVTLRSSVSDGTTTKTHVHGVEAIEVTGDD
jgi:hypothetical protein